MRALGVLGHSVPLVVRGSWCSVIVRAARRLYSTGWAVAQSGEVNVYSYREAKLIQPLFDLGRFLAQRRLRG